MSGRVRYGRLLRYFEPSPPERRKYESVEDMLKILLEIFEPQAEEIRERRYATRYAQYEEDQQQFEEQMKVQALLDAKRELEERAEHERYMAFKAEFVALGDPGWIGETVIQSLGHKFVAVADLRAATDLEILQTQGVGWKTLDAIRKHIHEHKWEKFETDAGQKGSYCPGCKARTGFVGCQEAQ
jgi:NAD-dependent DNA ligase